MATSFSAYIDSSVLVPDEPVDLSAGETLTVEVAETAVPVRVSPMRDDSPLLRLLRVLENFPVNLDAPTDAAATPDHYL